MITIINDAPENVAAFNATGDVTKEDFENLVIPYVKNKVKSLFYTEQLCWHNNRWFKNYYSIILS